MVEEVKEKLPPIVMISEALFTEKYLEPAYTELTKPLAVDVLTLDKSQTKTLLQTVITSAYQANDRKEIAARAQENPAATAIAREEIKDE